MGTFYKSSSTCFQMNLQRSPKMHMLLSVVDALQPKRYFPFNLLFLFFISNSSYIIYVSHIISSPHHSYITHSIVTPPPHCVHTITLCPHNTTLCLHTHTVSSHHCVHPPTLQAGVVSCVGGGGAHTCAVGDGGNDVSMLLAADVGVGLEGKEGMQASLAADFSLTQFQHLTRLLFWHGRNSCIFFLSFFLD